MARTKRNNLPANVDSPTASITWRAAGYIRLSIEDGGKANGDTLDGQKKLVTAFIEDAPDMTMTSLYCDNGCTGTDFQRPAFDRLMEIVKQGEVNCIVVKDLSRFGRNYKETGNYLERIFPFLGVRFIAINDNFDTLTAERNSDGYIAVLLNIVNEMYSKDLSAKLSATFHTKQKNGQYIGALPPYGYRKCADNINKLEPDSESAPIVQRIFEMKKSGVPSLEIARTFNAEGIASPGRLHCIRTGCKSSKMQNSLWEYQRIYNILRDPVYLGHVAQGRSLQSFHDGIAKKTQNRSEWIVVENVHEPLVDKETFQMVQTQKLERKTHPNPRPENMMKGLIYCADCGYAMVRNKAVGRYGTVTYSYYCRVCKDRFGRGTSKYINENVLFAIVMDAVAKQIEVAVQMDELVRRLQHLSRHQTRAERCTKEYAQLSAKLSRKRMLCDSLYQNYVEKLMTAHEYIAMKWHYRDEITALEEELNQLRKNQSREKDLTPDNPFLTAFCPFESDTQVSREMALALIKRLEIGEDKEIEITFLYRDEYQMLARYIGDANE